MPSGKPKATSTTRSGGLSYSGLSDNGIAGSRAGYEHFPDNDTYICFLAPVVSARGGVYRLCRLAAQVVSTAAHAHRAPGSLTTIEWNPRSGKTEIVHRLHSHDAELGVGTVAGIGDLSVLSLEERAHIALYMEERFAIATRDGRLPRTGPGPGADAGHGVPRVDFGGPRPTELGYNFRRPEPPSHTDEPPRSRPLSFKRDQKFFDMYSVVIGALVLIMVAIFVLAMKMSDLTQGLYTAETAEYQAAVAERLRPFGQVYLPGEEQQAAAPQVAAAPSAEPVATSLSGPQVYNEACIACHGSGIGGAPTLTDSANWQPRIAQGLETLRVHAIDGFTGQAGYMPPKGARLDLSDQEVYDAIDYMLAEIP